MGGIAALTRPTILFALALMAVIVMMILPVPAWALDIGLAISFGLAILIFTVTLFVQRPLDFSAFPSILLASLMLRLSLNVASTKLIIGEGHRGTSAAGGVIEGFAMFVMGGSLFLGLVVFGVLMIVNFIVITRGAARMAEVGARFALDGMPGKQLAIDSDMAAGAITHEEARARREREQSETTFFGSLDGASKFVKGDAVAGLLITLLNLVMGLIMGVAVHGLAIGQAFEAYAILTVGDGLVTQIPAVIISIAAALLLARGGPIRSTHAALTAQLGRYPAAMGTVALLMALFALVPGMPFVPFMLGAGVLGATAWVLSRRPGEADEPPAAEEPAPAERSLGDVLDLDEIHLEFAPDLVALATDPATGLDARILTMRTHVAEHYGLIFPEIRLTDSPALPPGGYGIRIHGAEAARDSLRPGRLLALPPSEEEDLPPGEPVLEPVYGAPALWVDAAEQEGLNLRGITVVSPAEVLATHLLETIRRNMGRLMTWKALRRLLDEMGRLSDPGRAEANRRLLDEMIPERVPLDLLLSVLRLLLEERVSIRNMPLILEAGAEMRGAAPSPEVVAEHVRQRLAPQILAGLRRPDGMLPLIQLAPEWEDLFRAHAIDTGRGVEDVALPPADFTRLGDAVAGRLAEAAPGGGTPAVVTAAPRRRFVQNVLAARGLGAPVLSFEEVGLHARPALVGVA
ncbi:MAG: flagellar biosynthesis protein FlhA [Rhodobacteraceae bacterium]|nr:flagellar biosynthesis protein FlhA [Paracoccaceae bacterium]